MTSSIVRFSVCLVAAAIFTAACGGSSSNTSSSTSTVAPAATTTAGGAMTGGSMAGGSGAGGGMQPMANAAPIPADVVCKGPIVWVNMSKKTYHMAGDPYYGRTKHGQYMCQAAADAKGYHMAGTPRSHTGSMSGGSSSGGSTSGATPAPAYT